MSHPKQDCGCECHDDKKHDTTCVLCYADMDECPSCEGLDFEDTDNLCLDCKKEYAGETAMRNEIRWSRL